MPWPIREKKHRKRRWPLPRAGSCGGEWPSGRCSRCLYFGPQGPGTARKFPACSVPPAASSPPRTDVPHSQRSENSLFQLPRKVHPSTLYSRGQQGRVPGWVSGPCVCVHTCSKAQRLGRCWPGIAGAHGRVQPPPLPHLLTPCKGTGDPADPPIRRERTQERAMGWETAQPGR